MIFFKGPQVTWTVQLEGDVETFFNRIESLLEPVSGFRLVSKLSDGGVVTRTLASPQTEKPIFGHRKENRIHFALCNIGKVTSPFQPICRCEWVADQDVIVLRIKPHQQALVLFPFYALTAGALLGLSVFCLWYGLVMAAIACLVIAILFIGIPYFRMLQGFSSDLEQLRRFLEAQGLNLKGVVPGALL